MLWAWRMWIIPDRRLGRMIWSSWTLKMMFVVAKGPILKVWSRLDMLWLRKPKLGAGGCCGFLTGYLKDGVILSWTSKMMLVVARGPILKVWSGLDMTWLRNPKLGLRGRWWFLTEDLEDRVILDTLDHLGRPPGTNPESFVKIWLHFAEL